MTNSDIVCADSSYENKGTSGIMLCFGSSKDIRISLNGNCLIIGGSKAGKSCLLNRLLVDVCTLYSRDELKVLMVDTEKAPRDIDMPHMIWSASEDSMKSMLNHLCSEIEERRKVSLDKLNEYPIMLLVVDNNRYIPNRDTIELLNKVLEQGPANKVYTLFATDPDEDILFKLHLESFSMSAVFPTSYPVSTKVLGIDVSLPKTWGYIYTKTAFSTHLWEVPLVTDKDYENICLEVKK